MYGDILSCKGEQSLMGSIYSADLTPQRTILIECTPMVCIRRFNEECDNIASLHGSCNDLMVVNYYYDYLKVEGGFLIPWPTNLSSKDDVIRSFYSIYEIQIFKYLNFHLPWWCTRCRSLHRSQIGSQISQGKSTKRFEILSYYICKNMTWDVTYDTKQFVPIYGRRASKIWLALSWTCV